MKTVASVAAAIAAFASVGLADDGQSQTEEGNA
ncbi:hypothetical protein CfE428DRAFT_4404 [Chthoniobacter flavus Ellin428]|uniref:Uncharacterized protein n=1 Tax=Chthoniobacter flavus Ellin428 TaxID=497964 RepID=B4D665_9BACT|nr:hypothetical protein CfE428DRAFT_4404 [Chthoniobacter flavus Ellin428]TCO88217.1 hypothetical protein EV701_11813 [Chthoniobacter flavus]